MRFLDPISGLIAAAIAVPLLLLLYFLRLRRKTLRVSSTLLWEQAFADLQVNVPFRWLRVSALLALQMLALGALIAALARPAIPGEAPVADRVVLIIDHSASMSARDGELIATSSQGSSDGRPTRLDTAKRQAVEIVRELERSAGSGAAASRPTITVIASAATARIVQPATTFSADAIDAINGIEPSDLPGGLTPALELLESTRAAARGGESETSRSTGHEQVIGVTDSSVTGALRVVRLEAGHSTETTNLGIVAFNVRRDENNPETVRVFVRVTGPGRVPITTGVRLTIDERVVASRVVTVPVGGAAVTFEIASRDGDVVVASLERADVLDADNAAGAVIGPVTSPSIVVVAAARDDGAAEADPFLMGFLESLSPRQLRVMTMDAFTTDVRSSRRDRARSLAGVDLVIFDRVEPDAESMPDQPTISFGAGLPRPGLRLRASAEEAAATGVAVRFDTWKRTHPLMQYVSLDTTIVSPRPRTIAVDESGSTAATEHAVSTVVLAAGPDGPLIVAAEEVGATGSGSTSRVRNVVVSFALRRSNWATDASFAVFMTNAVDAMLGAGAAAEGMWFGAGTPLVVRPSVGAGVVTATGPQQLEADANGSTGPISLGVPHRTGVYSIAGAEVSAACVNLLDIDETMLGGEPAGDVAGGTPATSAPNVSVAEAREPQKSWREIWHLFILAAMALAAAEWILFARASRA